MRALILQHVECEPAAVYEDELRAAGADLTVVEVDVERTVPDWREFDLIVSMGGPQSVYEEQRTHWIQAEKHLIASAARAGRPVWGVCLGAQMLAAALGARVYAGPRPELGLLPVRLTPAAAVDPVFGVAPHSIPTLQWHGDTFDLPEGAVLLATSGAYTNQAFSWGRSYGLQFHLEVGATLAERWAAVPGYDSYLERALGPGALDRLIADLGLEGPQINRLGREIFQRWLDLVADLGGMPRPDDMVAPTT